ncbi:hypothetical protein DOTSEDRAFT_68510 [Dothistroma septosporum NZE10]|uniref:Uncharacterized protein n=1 Tax=Dothistroma septosporum (strain NZE10 / CBS 128990) TaxID=675120 RepID=N1Q239_DOTSN|nr:hypothetical protein DOTSEDRAFT_68510 [Dothistroma septosporum NZE10]
MSHTTGRNRIGDLFLEVAADNDFDESMASDDELGQRQRLPSTSRASYSGKRRSLPADVVVNNANDRRPSTGGHLHARPSSRLHTHRAYTDLQRHMDQYKSPTNRTTLTFGDNVSVSGQSNSSRSRRYSAAPARSPASPSRLRERLQSPELPDYGRRRPSFGTTVTPSRTMESFEEESTAEDSDPKQADSTSNESQPAETVWDELDDLKSRIKSLEFNGQAHTSSSAAASGDSSDRPRTATTAPTTIDSSPKNVRKLQSESRKPTPTAPETPNMTKTMADIHPPLHTALEKARLLLNASLMRTLDATASDALQLAAITSSAGPQGTNYSAASIINGLTVSDRHVRRKVDNMCRNLTELCLALCEGKHEAPTILASPAPTIETPMLESPSIRYSSGKVAQRSSSIGRPVSRLEARKSSILGGNTISLAGNTSPRGSVEDVSFGEQETIQNPAYLQQPRRVSRAPSSVFSSRQRQDDISGDEDSNNFRPPSRAMTEVGALRNKSRITNETRSPAGSRTASLRESLTIKTNEAAFERNRDTPRVASIGSGGRRRRLFDNESTPPVMEEDTGTSEYNTPSQPRRRITSLGHYGNDHYSSRRSDLPGRTTSLSQRRHVIVE